MNQRILQISAIAFFTVLTFNLSAQKMYFGVQTGYGFATSAGQANLVNRERIDLQDSYEVVKGGYGEGVNWGIKMGRNFNKTIGFEIGTDFLLSKTLTQENLFYLSNDGSVAFSDEQTTSLRTNVIFLSPKVVFNFPNKSKFSPYSKVGLTLGFFTKVKEKIVDTSIGGFSSFTITETEGEYKGGVPVGVNAVFGVNYQLKNQFILYAEMDFLNISYSPKTHSIVSLVSNGNEEIDKLNTRQREIIYLDNIDADTINLPTEPRKQTRILLPMSVARFNLGLRVDL